jgi:hypothetical protein
MMADGVGNSNATHGATTSVMEAAKAIEKILSKAPNFTTVQ